MNSNIPSIKVTNKPLTQKTVDDLNKLSTILLQKQKSNMAGGTKRRQKRSKTRKLMKKRV